MRLSTIVVGGGIGGLSLARELTLAGLGVVVLEREREPADSATDDDGREPHQGAILVTPC